MKTIIIRPRNNEEESFLKSLLDKLNIDLQIVEEPLPNYKTIKAIEELESGKGNKVSNSDELFSELGI